MKKTLFVLVVVCVFPLFLKALEVGKKFGKVKMDELQMTTYLPDTSACAVILYENTNIEYSFSVDGDFQLDKERFVKIKILKPEGVKYANVIISYLHIQTSEEKILSLSANAHNLINGKDVVTPLKSENIFKENKNDNYDQVRFAIPEVKVGTVIEYKYFLRSPFAERLPDIVMQQNIPILESKALIVHPDFFNFNLNVKGYNPIKVEHSSQEGTYLWYGGRLTVKNAIYELSAEQVPALSKEPMVWCFDDYLSKAEFELRSVTTYNQIMKNYLVDWEDIDKTLNHTKFTKNLRTDYDFKKIVEQIKNSGGDDRSKIRKIHRLVMSNMAWNGQYHLASRDISTAVKNKSGSSADLNSVLTSALTDAGYHTSIILLNPKEMGQLPLTHPSLDKINTFLVRVDLPNTEPIYLDATNPKSDLNLLPPSLAVNRAKVFMSRGIAQWVDLSILSNNNANCFMSGSLDSKGMLNANVSITYTGTLAMIIKEKYQKCKSENEFIEQLENADEIKISQFSIHGLDTSLVRIEYTCAKKLETSAERIYMNHCVFKFMSKNIFQSSTRTLPVEFPYTENYKISCIISLPEGVSVEAVPENKSLRIPTNEIMARSLTQHDARNLSMRFDYQLKKDQFPAESYAELYGMFGNIVHMSNEQVVLKK